ncbi:MAG: phosphomannomutase/phosphoglucomutase [Alphaproteobacteria bacterium]|nr:phosphomannomutase/phosphoglucomutase [Alphaproteobacteria bacterium]
MHLPARSLFRAYDVRGIVGETLSATDFLAIGHAFASHVADACQTRTPLIVALRDGRESSPNLIEAFIEGMLRAGAHVLDAGVGPTPLCYFATHHLDADGSVMVTGSHNPPTHNGAKFMCDGKSLFGEALASLRDRIADNNLLHSRGKREEVDLRDEYLFELHKALGQGGALDHLSVAWDAGNGVAGGIISELLRGAKAGQTTLYLDDDSRFPHHHPDPSVAENLADLQTAIIAGQGALALGVAFDGDGDRLGAVDDLGRIVAPDHLLMLLADDVLAREAGATIIADVKTSDHFFARVKAQGGTPLLWLTGHAHIKAKLAETGAKFAGEASGHIFFADSYYGYDDGIYAALRLVRLVAESGKKLSTLVDALPKIFATPEIRLPCADDQKFAIIDALKAQFPQAVTLDGVRVTTADGWWLIRASNTQAALSARAEASCADGLTKVMHAMHTALSSHGVRV